MSWPVRVKSVAESEFVEGAVWYHLRSEKAAEAFIVAVEETLSRIGESPDVYPVVHRTRVCPKFS